MRAEVRRIGGRHRIDEFVVCHPVDLHRLAPERELSGIVEVPVDADDEASPGRGAHLEGARAPRAAHASPQVAAALDAAKAPLANQAELDAGVGRVATSAAHLPELRADPREASVAAGTLLDLEHVLADGR